MPIVIILIEWMYLREKDSNSVEKDIEIYKFNPKPD